MLRAISPTILFCVLVQTYNVCLGVNLYVLMSQRNIEHVAIDIGYMHELCFRVDKYQKLKGTRLGNAYNKNISNILYQKHINKVKVSWRPNIKNKSISITKALSIRRICQNHQIQKYQTYYQ